MTKQLSAFLVLYFLIAIDTWAQSPVSLPQNSEWYNSPALVHHRYHEVLLNSEDFRIRMENINCGHLAYKIISKAWLQNDPSLIERLMHTEVDPYIRLVFYEELGFLYQKNRKWKLSINAFGKADTENKGKFDYFIGYNWYQIGNLDSATYLFEEVTKKVDHPYYSRASYYLGIINDNEGIFDEALTHYLNSTSDSLMIPLVHNRVVNILTDNGANERALEVILSWIKKTDPVTQIDLKAQLGEVYFYLEDYAKSVEYFSQSVPKRTKWSEELYYKYGYSLESLGDNANAKIQYEFAGNSPTLTGQLASYRLGNIFTLLSQYTLASAAFETAARLDFDKLVKESAAFHHGKVLMQSGRTAEAITSLEDFINRYYTSSYKSEAQALLAEAFLLSADYSKAINYYARLSNLTKEQELGYVRASYQQASVYYNSGKIEEAYVLLRRVEDYTADPLLNARFSRLMGDVYYQKEEYKKAIDKYSIAKSGLRISDPELGYVMYSLGISYYSDGQPQKAAEILSTIRPNGIIERSIGQEAQLRHADALYALGNLEQALALYEDPSFTNQTDYRMYQAGICYYLLGKDLESVEILDKLIGQFPNSTWADNAIFQSANTEFEKQAFTRALQKFSNFEKLYKENTLFPNVLLNKGLCYANLGQYSEAFNTYSQLINEYPGHEKSAEAILGMQDLQKRGFAIENINDFIDLVRKTNPTNQVLQSIEYEQALASYFSKDYQQAVTLFMKYLNGSTPLDKEADAIFYLGDCLQKLGKWKESVGYFEKIVAAKNTLYLGRSLDKLARAQFTISNYREALNSFKQLEKSAANKREKFTGREGQMESYYALQSFDSAIFKSDEIINGEWFPLHADLNAKLVKYKSLRMLGRESQGIDLLVEICNSGQNIYSAEAHFLLAESMYASNDLLNAREVLLTLINSQAAFKIWVDSSYFMLVEIYRKMGEEYQAKAILQSILDKADDSALKERAALKLKEMEENSLIEQNDTINR